MSLSNDPEAVAQRARYAASAEVREKRAETDREWREANRERKAETARKWHVANRERVAETHREWLTSNPECSIENCTRKYVTKGWCATHYKRWQKTGDPLGVKQEYGASGADSVSWKGDDITYHTVHVRLTKRKGKAAQHGCVTCGSPAKHWAYDHTDPDEKIGESRGRPMAFSTDMDRYQPMCRSCHGKLDQRCAREREKGDS